MTDDGVRLFYQKKGDGRRTVILPRRPFLFPVIGVALLGLRRAPFAAVLAIVCTSLEKSVEFIGQALLVFPPEEVIGGVAIKAVVVAMWDQMFFLLWCCNTAGAGAAGILMLRLAPPRFNLVFIALAWTASFLTLIMLLGPEYVGLPLPSVNEPVFFLIFTGYRAALALTLAKATPGEAQSA